MPGMALFTFRLSTLPLLSFLPLEFQLSTIDLC
jgi:hypothetical protein